MRVKEVKARNPRSDIVVYAGRQIAMVEDEFYTRLLFRAQALKWREQREIWKTRF
ncbi:MAG: hypothetical protein MI740_04290 [Halanaerobiales bacterium]|nr:hypothetical protein [Halanaerobiales bacterium]